MQIEVEAQVWPLREPLRVHGHSIDSAEVVVATVRAEGHSGRGEGVPVWYKGETVDGMVAEARRGGELLQSGVSREQLLHAMPASSARNALDAALWSLEAQSSGRSVPALAGKAPLEPIATAFTISLDTAERMAAAAHGLSGAGLLKLKLGGDPLDEARIRAVRAARPDARIALDANQGWTPEHMRSLAPLVQEMGVVLLEQPLPMGQEEDLRGLSYPCPLAADESVQDLDDLERLVGCFQVVNIKLDKCGGLTRALQMVEAARSLGLIPMVGCMGGTSLAMAAHAVAAADCLWADIDGAFFLAEDRPPPIRYVDGTAIVDDPVWAG